MNEAIIANIFNFLSAYLWADVKEAFKRLNKDMVRGATEQREAALDNLRKLGWVEHTGDVPSGFEWQRIGHRVFVRDPKSAAADPSRVTVQGPKAGTRSRQHKKTDTGVQRVPDIKCPICGGEVFKEGICPGCDEGRRGLKVRLLCGECEYSLSL
jgi:hypothetical protein